MELHRDENMRHDQVDAGCFRKTYNHLNIHSSFDLEMVNICSLSVASVVCSPACA